MQISAPSSTSTASVTAPGAVLGTGIVQAVTTGGVQFYVPTRVDITAGSTLLSGVKDIAAAAYQLIAATHSTPGGSTGPGTGLVGFVRNGDAYDAVQLLAPRFTDGSSRRQVYAPWNIASFEPIDDLVAVWQISHFGFDSLLRKPGSMFRTGSDAEPQA